MTNIINRYANIKNILLLFGLILFFNLIIFPLLFSTNKDLIPLDLRISYSPDEAYTLLEKYNQTERRNYFVGALTIDLIYPVIYTLFLCFTIFLLHKNIKLAQFPIFILISDYIENFGIVIMIFYYPNKLTNIALATSLFTSIKWFFVFVSIAVIIYGLLKKIHNLIIKKNN